MVVSIVLATMLMAVPQGGQGGFGGGGGGAAGSGIGGRTGPGFGEEETFKHILTPGDKTEWPIQAKAGEVVILRATSASFDPAVEVNDAEGVKVGENDDEEPGKQNALLLVYFEKAGKYTAHVKNYRSTAGGPYELSVRRFIAHTVDPDKPAVVDAGDAPVYVRVVAPKDRIVVLGNSRNTTFNELIAPSGKPAEWLPKLGGTVDRAFRVQEEGAYFARTHVYGGVREKATLAVREARVRHADLGKPVRTRVEPDGIDVWTVSAKAGDFFRVSARATRSLEFGIGKSPESSFGTGPDEPYRLVRNVGKWRDTANLLFQKEGTYEFYVRASSTATEYTFELANAWTPWSGSGQLTGDLEIGASAYYGFDVKPGYLARFEAEAKSFDILIELFDGGWEEQARLDDSNWRSTDAADTVFLETEGRHYVALTSNGGGGGGAYRLNVTLIAPKPLKVGEWLDATLATPLDGLWAVGLTGAKTYGLRLRGGNDLRITDPKGQILGTRSVRVGSGDWLMLFDTAEAGEYRVWVKPDRDNPKVSLRLEPIDRE